MLRYFGFTDVGFILFFLCIIYNSTNIEQLQLKVLWSEIKVWANPALA